MKNPVLRWTLIVLGVLVAVVLIAAGALAFLVSRIDARAEIERAVERATGRELVITGNVGVSFYPVLGLRATQASLANAPGGRAPALAAVGALSVGVELRPLLNREVVVRELVLTEPRIALEIDALGRPNWALSPPRPETPSSPRLPDELEPQHFTLERVEIRRGQIAYFDARRRTAWAITDVNVVTALKSLDEPVTLTGDLVYAGQKVDLQAVIGLPRAALAGRPTTIAARISSEVLTGTLEGDVATATGVFSGNVAMQGTSLRRALAWLVAPIPAGYGLETFTVNGRLSTGPRQIAFENAALTLDAVRGRGDFTLQQQRGKPYVSGRLELIELDVNPYIAAAAQGAGDAAAVAEAASAPRRTIDVTQAPIDTPLDFSGLKSINADLELTTGPLKFQRLHAEHAQLSLVLNDGYLAATLHELRMYGGSGRGRMELDARTDDPRFVQELRATGVNANGFLGDAIGFGNLEGTTEAYINVTTHGATQAAILRQLDGRVSFELRSGALRGVDLGGVATTIRRALNDDLVAPNARTALNGMSATFAISDGVMASETLSFNTPDLQLRGLGVIDLPGRRLDLRVVPQNAVLGIPFRVQGPWTGLLYASDLSGRGRDEIQARVRQVQQAARRSGG